MANASRFVWYELMTTDVEAAKAFYSEVLGWKTRAWPGAMEYTTFNIGDEGVAGLMALPEEAKAHGAPPHWMGYLGVDDADATSKRIAEMGGTIIVPPQDIPEVGRFGVATDPQGAVFAYIKTQPPEGAKPYEGEPRPGDVSWHELNTTDYEGAWKFYAALTGWKHSDTFDMGPEMGNYWMFTSGDDVRASKGGMSNMARAHGFPAHWLYYITVTDVAAAVRRVESHGGKVLNGPMEVPDGSTIAQCMDPQGAMFALNMPAK